jgi:hypothetical protein
VAKTSALDNNRALAIECICNLPVGVPGLFRATCGKLHARNVFRKLNVRMDCIDILNISVLLIMLGAGVARLAHVRMEEPLNAL